VPWKCVLPLKRESETQCPWTRDHQGSLSVPSTIWTESSRSATCEVSSWRLHFLRVTRWNDRRIPLVDRRRRKSFRSYLRHATSFCRSACRVAHIAGRLRSGAKRDKSSLQRIATCVGDQLQMGVRFSVVTQPESQICPVDSSTSHSRSWC